MLLLALLPDIPSSVDQPLVGVVEELNIVACAGAALRADHMFVRSVPAEPISRSPSLSQSCAMPLVEPEAAKGETRGFGVT